MALPSIFVTIGAKIEGFERAMGTVSQRISAIERESKKAFAGFEKVGDSLTRLGTGLSAAITLPLAGAGVAATKFASDFELEMRKVTSLLGGATAQEFKQLNSQVLELSKSMGIDATKAAQGLYEVISAGVPKENAIDFLAVASKTAIAGVTDTKVAVDALTTIIAAYALSADDAKEVSDAMFQAVNVGKFTFEQLAAAIGPAAQQAANLGITYTELLAATATLSKTSGGVGQAVTQIESAMRSLLDPTKQMKAGLEAIGFSTGSAAVKALGLEGTLQKLREQTGGSAEAFNALFGRIEGATGALGLTGAQAALTKKDYDDLKRSTEGLGAGQKAFEEINQTTVRQFEQLSAKLKVTAIELGTALLPRVNDLLDASKPLVDLISRAVKAFTDLPQPIQTAALGFTVLLAALGPVLFGLGQLIALSISAATAFKTLQAALALTTIGKIVTGQLVGPMALAETRAVSLLAALKGLAVPIVVGLVVKGALDSMAQTQTAINNLKTAAERQRNEMNLLNAAYRDQEVAAGRLAPQVNRAKDSVLDFVKGMKSAIPVVKEANKVLKDSFSDIERKKIEDYKKEILDSEKAERLRNQALRELGKEVKEAGDKHRDAAGKVRAFSDIFPILAAKVGIVQSEQGKLIAQIAAYELAVERGEKGTADFTLEMGELTEQLKETVDLLPQPTILIDELNRSLKDSTKPIQDVIDAYHRMGQQTPHEIAKTVEAHRQAWETIKKESGTGSVAALEAWVKYETSRQEAARRSGHVIPEEQRKALDKAQAQLDAALGKQTSSVSTWARQVSTIINDLARDFAKGIVTLVKGLFGFDNFNKDLEQQSAKLREELAVRTGDLENFRATTETQIEALRVKYSDALTKETEELRESLAKRTADYEQYVTNVQADLDELRNKESDRLAGEIENLSTALREKEAAYQEYQQGVAEKEKELRETHAERLADQLRDLQENLRDRQQSYDDFVADANQSLQRIGADLAETIDDATRGVNRRIEDENADFARDQERLNDDIREAEKRGDKKRATELRRTLKQRTEDHEKSIRRLKEDLAEQVDDARRRAEEQTADLKRNLERRTRDHREFLEENERSQKEAVEKNRKSLDEQLSDLKGNLDRRTAELLRFRDETAGAIEAASAASARRILLAEQEAAAKIEQRKRELDDFATSVDAKIAALTENYQKKLDEETAALTRSLDDRLAEYDKYRSGVETKLKELEEAHKGPLDRIKELFTGVFNSAAEAVLRLASEEVLGKLIGKLTSLATDILPGLGKAISTALGIGGTAAAGADDFGSVIGGGGAGSGSAGAAAGTGITGVIGLVSGIATAVSGIIGNFQMAGMNENLQLIEKEVRYSQIHLKEILERGVNLFLAELPNITGLQKQFIDKHASRIHDVWERIGVSNDRLNDIKDLLAGKTPALGMLSMAGGPPVHVHVYVDSKEVADAIVESSEVRGITA